MGSGAAAGVQTALAVRTRDMTYANQPAPAPTSWKQPDYKARLDELEKQTWDCVEGAGFKRVTS